MVPPADTLGVELGQPGVRRGGVAAERLGRAPPALHKPVDGGPALGLLDHRCLRARAQNGVPATSSAPTSVTAYVAAAAAAAGVPEMIPGRRVLRGCGGRE